MKFIVLNGSPKSEKSVTMQSIKYIEKKFGSHEFEYIHIIKEIKGCEADKNNLARICERIQKADGVIWAFPVYYLLVPAHYKRFIELIFENGLQESFKDKYTSVFSTSVHFADNTAHAYMRGICEDLGMKYVDYLSHHMQDLLAESRRKDLVVFFENLIMHVNENLATTRLYNPIIKGTYKYLPGKTEKFVDTDKRVIILTDAQEEDNNIKAMVNKFCNIVRGKAEVINLYNVDIKGYCMGCCKCGAQNICAYNDKDGYRKFLDHVIENGDIIIFAGTIRDRYLSSRFKLYYDRSFCYTHIPFFRGKQIGYMFSGRLRELENLRQIFETCNQGNTNLIGFITDESENNDILDAEIYSFAKIGAIFAQNSYIRPANFLGVGLKQVFTGMLKGFPGGIFAADYKYYKKIGAFKKIPLVERLKGVLMRYLMSRKRFREEVYKNIFDHMITGHKKVLAGEEK